jgi:type IV pilus assembly protein PilM
MTMRLLARSLSPIGIDIDARRVEAIQLRRAGASWRLTSLASLPRVTAGAEITADEVQRLADVLYRQGFNGRDVALAVPPSKLLSSMLELPPRTPGMPFDQVARMEFARIQKCDPQSFEMSYWDLPAPARAQKTTNVMAVGCRYTDAEVLLSLFEGAGFDVRTLDTRTGAVARAAQPLIKDDPTSAMLDIGWQSASLCILRRGVVIYDRALGDSGIESLQESLAGQFALDADAVEYLVNDVGLNTPASADGPEKPEQSRLREAATAIEGHFESVIKDLQTSFVYATHQYPDAPVARLLLIGRGAAIPRLPEYLSEMLKVPVQIASPAHLIECPPAFTSASNPIYTAACGLALAGSD